MGKRFIKTILMCLLMVCMLTGIVICMTGCGSDTSASPSSGGSSDISASGDNSASRNQRETIVTTLFASYDFARQLTAGTDIQVTLLLKPGTETHSYDPTVDDILKIADCGLFIYNGGENDAWVDEVLDSMDCEIPCFRMMDHSVLVPEEIQEHMDSNEKADDHYPDGGQAHQTANDADDDEEAEWDEHVWTSPANAISITQALALQLEDMYPEYAEIIGSNQQVYQKELEDLDKDFKELCSKSSRNTLIFADRFPVRYFVEQYGLDYYAAFPGCSADAEASAETVMFLMDMVVEEKIPVVFYVEMSDRRMADTISEATGAQELEFHSGHTITAEDFEKGATYISIMRGNLENLRIALN